MRLLRTALFFVLPFAFSMAAQAQDRPKDNQGDSLTVTPRGESLPAPEPLIRPESETDEAESDEAEAGAIDGEDVVPKDLEPDYSKLSPKAEREARLKDLFIELAERENEEGANLVAEEITAIWVESGSASVNLLLRRGSDAVAKGDPKMARKMYNHAVDLSPEFAEAWARSARLALTQKDFNRALNESLTTLAIEPRHFYTLWTLGNTLEALNRPDEALEAYREANKLYPELKAVKERMGALEAEVDGTVL